MIDMGVISGLMIPSKPRLFEFVLARPGPFAGPVPCDAVSLPAPVFCPNKAVSDRGLPLMNMSLGPSLSRTSIEREWDSGVACGTKACRALISILSGDVGTLGCGRKQRDNRV